MKIAIIQIITALVMFNFAFSQSAGGPHNYVPQNFDVIEYSPVLLIENPESKEVKGINTIKIEWNKPAVGNEFYFHNLGIKVDSVFYDGERVLLSEITETNPTNTYNSIFTTNDHKIGEVKIYYSGIMPSEGGVSNWGGVHYSNKLLFAVGVGFYNDEVSCTRNWMPCYDLPSDKALYTGTFIVPDTLMAISNGILLEKKDTLGNFTKYKWTLGKDVVATYLLTFAVGKFSEVDIPSEDVPVKAYMYDNQISTEAGKIAFKLVPKMIKAFENFFSYKYPYETMGYYGANIGNMEHQSLVTMSQSQINKTATANDTMFSDAAHELGHQWFGDLVTPYDFRDAWINEGFAVFTEYVWIESQFSDEKYREGLLKLRSDYINNIAIPEQHIPLYNFHRFSKNNYPSTIYKKGGLIIALIRDIVGDKIFKEKIHDYLQSNEFANVTTQTLIDEFSDILPQKFWDTWVYGRGFPLIDIFTFQKNENTYVIAKQQDNEFQDFELRLDYLLDFDGNPMKVSHYIDSKSDTLIIPNSAKLNKLEVVDNYYPYRIMSINAISSVNEESKEIINIKYNIFDKIIDLNFDKINNYQIEIVTLDGKKLFVESGQYVGMKKINISSFVAGIYFVYIRYEGKTIVKKIMVM